MFSTADVTKLKFCS